MATSTVITALAYAGVGAGVGSIGAAFISARSGKGEARAHAADMLANGYGGLADRLDRRNKQLETDNHKLKATLLKLTDTVDALLEKSDRKVLSEAKEINDAAKLVL